MSNRRLTIGIDEAGRGPLAGPVVAAAVIIDKKIEGVKDSKTLSPEARDFLFDLIIKNAIAFGIGVSSQAEIDSINILQATFLSMRRAVDSLHMCYRLKHGKDIAKAIVLVDGNKTIPMLDNAQKAIVDGDASVYEISAASIVAKVTRDRIMESLAKKYPQYGFERHKGYATAEHRKAILKYGPCEIHRKTFLRKLYENEQKLFG
ncbi:MAG: ribonuclease HII [Caldisericaceae bacterium]